MKDMIEFIVYIIVVFALFGVLDIVDKGGFTYTIDGVKHTVQFGTTEKK